MFETIDRVLMPAGLQRWVTYDMDFRQQMERDCQAMATARKVPVRIVTQDGVMLREFTP